MVMVGGVMSSKTGHYFLVVILIKNCAKKTSNDVVIRR